MMPKAQLPFNPPPDGVMTIDWVKDSQARTRARILRLCNINSEMCACVCVCVCVCARAQTTAFHKIALLLAHAEEIHPSYSPPSGVAFV